MKVDCYLENTNMHGMIKLIPLLLGLNLHLNHPRLNDILRGCCQGIQWNT